MRLSEAIATGRVVVAPLKGYLFVPGMRGCALGMACVAAGVGVEPRIGDDYKNVDLLFKEWPWLGNRAERKCLVNKCKEAKMVVYNYHQAIAHMFDNHIASYRTPTLTLDQLIDYVRYVEPIEPEELHLEQNAVELIPVAAGAHTREEGPHGNVR